MGQALGFEAAGLEKTVAVELGFGEDNRSIVVAAVGEVGNLVAAADLDSQ